LRQAYDLAMLVLIHAINGDGYAILLSIIAFMITALLAFLGTTLIRSFYDSWRQHVAAKANRYRPYRF
jgi:hypothetical protein